MKKTTLLLLGAVISCKIFSFTPIPDSSSIWINATFSALWVGQTNPTTSYWYNKICANDQDTIINTTEYKSLVKCLDEKYLGAIRNDNGKTWIVPTDSTTEFLLYDFTGQKGDTLRNVFSYEFETNFSAGGTNDYIIQDVFAIQIDGDNRQVIDIKEGGMWVEGIGNTYGFLLPSFITLADIGFELNCHSSGIKNLSDIPKNLSPGSTYSSYDSICDITISTSKIIKSNVQIYPNPTNESFVVSAPVGSSISLLNSSGVLISKSLLVSKKQTFNIEKYPPGTYIITISNKEAIYHKKIIKQ